MMKRLAFLAVLAFLPFLVACESKTDTTGPGPISSTPAVVVHAAISSFKIIDLPNEAEHVNVPAADGTYRLSANTKYELWMTIRNPRVAGRTIKLTATPSWTSAGTDETLESAAPAEWTGSHGELLKWRSAPVGAQTIILQLTEFGGDLPTAYVVEQKIQIIFS